MNGVPNLSYLAHQLDRHVVPLFTLVKGRAKSIGTGFFLRAASDQYLVSAAHVLDNLKEKRLLFYFMDAHTWRPVTGYVRQTISPVPRDRRTDRLDIGIVHLVEPHLPPYKSIDIASLSISDVAGNALPRFGKQYIVTGYPASKCDVNPVTQKIQSRALAFRANSVPEAIYDKVRLSTKSHIVIPFDPKRVADEYGNPAYMWSPTGLSGSPIWVVEHVPTAYLWPRVVGVMIEHRKEHRVLVATDANVIFDLLRRPEIPAPNVHLDWPLNRSA